MGLEIGGNRQQDVQLALLCLSFCIYVHGPCTCMSVLFEICSLLSMGRHRFYAGKYMYEPTSSFHFQSSSTENLVFQFLSVTYFLKFCLCWLLYPDSHIQKELRTEVDFSTKFALFWFLPLKRQAQYIYTYIYIYIYVYTHTESNGKDMQSKFHSVPY